MVRSLLVLAAVCTLACAPGMGGPSRASFVVPGASVDDVWRAAVTVLRERAWFPAEARHGRDIGTVATDWFPVGGRGPDFMNCGDEAYRTPDRGRIEIEVVRRPGEVAVDIRPRWRGRTRTDEIDECLTRGVVEGELRQAMLALLPGGRPRR